MNIKITDNFMPKDVFKEYQSNIYKIPWTINPILTSNINVSAILCDEIDNFWFTHEFYSGNKQVSEYYYKFIEQLLPHIKVRSLIRVKINANIKTEKIIKHGFHIDYKAVVNGEVQETHNCFTSILYLNTNDGYTEFENGTKIKSIENRLITFPLSYRHTGTTCTNQPFRSVINFNYF